MGLSGRESKESRGQEIGWSRSSFCPAENPQENTGTASVFQREGIPLQPIGPLIGAFVLSLAQKSLFAMSSVPDGGSDSYELRATVQDVRNETKRLLGREQKQNLTHDSAGRQLEGSSESNAHDGFTASHLHGTFCFDDSKALILSEQRWIRADLQGAQDCLNSQILHIFIFPSCRKLLLRS